MWIHNTGNTGHCYFRSIMTLLSDRVSSRLRLSCQRSCDDRGPEVSSEIADTGDDTQAMSSHLTSCLSVRQTDSTPVIMNIHTTAAWRKKSGSQQNKKLN